MLGKLLKYDFKAIGRILLPIYGAVIIMSIISAFSFRPDSFMFEEYHIFRLLSVLVVVIYVALIIAALVLSFLMSVFYFKRSLLGSEGYLMNTLPVSQNKSIAAMLIASCVYQIASVIVVSVSTLFSVCTAVGTELREWLDAFSYLLSLIADNNAIIIYVIESALVAAVSLIGANLMFYASMAVGHSFSSGKTAKSILSFIGFYIISQIINSVLIVVLNSTAILASIPSDMYIIGIILLQTAYAVGYFLIASYFLKNKLNLQ